MQTSQIKAFYVIFASILRISIMKKSIIWALILLIVVAAVYRVIPGRPWGFAPQWAMALFAGAMIKDKKWAFALPLF